MKIFRHSFSSISPSVIAVGNFDGLHRGHQALIAQAREEATRSSVPLSVMSFSPHPREYFGNMKGRSLPLALVPPHHKLRLFAEHGVEQCIILHFDAQLAQMPAERFVEDILMRQCRAHGVVTGDNFIFGHNRSGNVETLSSYARQGAFTYQAIASICDEAGTPYSSTRVRKALADANMQEAEAVLGRRYCLVGRVRRGDQRGRTIGFPTANIALPHLHVPAYGVYAVRYRICEEGARGEWRDGVANIGVRPTIMSDDVPANLEVHGLDESRDLYGKRLEVAFVNMIRPEQRFDSIDALKAQIALDVEAAKAMLRSS